MHASDRKWRCIIANGCYDFVSSSEVSCVEAHSGRCCYASALRSSAANYGEKDYRLENWVSHSSARVMARK